MLQVKSCRGRLLHPFCFGLSRCCIFVAFSTSICLFPSPPRTSCYPLRPFWKLWAMFPLCFYHFLCVKQKMTQTKVLDEVVKDSRIGDRNIPRSRGFGGEDAEIQGFWDAKPRKTRFHPQDSRLGVRSPKIQEFRLRSHKGSRVL